MTARTPADAPDLKALRQFDDKLAALCRWVWRRDNLPNQMERWGELAMISLKIQRDLESLAAVREREARDA